MTRRPNLIFLYSITSFDFFHLSPKCWEAIFCDYAKMRFCTTAVFRWVTGSSACSSTVRFSSALTSSAVTAAVKTTAFKKEKKKARHWPAPEVWLISSRLIQQRLKNRPWESAPRSRALLVFHIGHCLLLNREYAVKCTIFVHLNNSSDSKGPE